MDCYSGVTFPLTNPAPSPIMGLSTEVSPMPTKATLKRTAALERKARTLARIAVPGLTELEYDALVIKILSNRRAKQKERHLARQTKGLSPYDAYKFNEARKAKETAARYKRRLAKLAREGFDQRELMRIQAAIQKQEVKTNNAYTTEWDALDEVKRLADPRLFQAPAPEVTIIAPPSQDAVFDPSKGLIVQQEPAPLLIIPTEQTGVLNQLQPNMSAPDLPDDFMAELERVQAEKDASEADNLKELKTNHFEVIPTSEDDIPK